MPITIGMTRWPLALAASVLLAASPARAQQKPPAFSWVVAENGQTPRGTLAAGTENNQPTAACRILVQGALYAGRLTNGACRAGLMGREVADKRYEVFVADPHAVVWLHSAQIGRLPPGAIAGGYEPGPRVNILCRTQLAIGMVPGRYAGKGCVVSNANGEVTTASFEVAALAQPPRTAAVRSLASEDGDAFAKDAQAAIATMEAELASAGTRGDDPLFGHIQRLGAALNEVSRLAGTRQAPPAGPAARAITAFEQATEEARAAIEQIMASLGPADRSITQTILAILAKQQTDLARVMAASMRRPSKT